MIELSEYLITYLPNFLWHDKDDIVLPEGRDWTLIVGSFPEFKVIITIFVLLVRTNSFWLNWQKNECVFGEELRSELKYVLAIEESDLYFINVPESETAIAEQSVWSSTFVEIIPPPCWTIA